MADNLKILAAVLLVAAGVAGFYLLSELPTVFGVLSVILSFMAAAGVVWFTDLGKRFYGFAQESVVEARKVVWPTRKETMQMTGIVVIFVIIMALFLWLVDGSLTWLVKFIMQRGE
jgi:preprotein translocase subunit SecE